MKTILFFSPTGFIGGAERNLINICTYLPKDQFKPIVILPNQGDLPKILQSLGIKIYFFPAYFYIPAKFSMYFLHA